MSTTVSPSAPASAPEDGAEARPSRVRQLPATLLRALLTQRIVLLLVLLVAVLVTFWTLSSRNYLTAPYDLSYLSATLISAVPLVMLGLAELLVITSGRGGIDLSVGAIVSLVSMVFGFAYGQWGWPLWASIVLAAAFGGLCGAINGFLIAYVGYPALITTLATYYAFSSIAIVINDQEPISTQPIQDFFSAARSVPIGG
ncbi:MAG TPA: hypothetical protein VM684_05825, partial [Gaiellales bacterium]|nr:hypothetical protein [Gaiellales bacterium]